MKLLKSMLITLSIIFILYLVYHHVIMVTPVQEVKDIMLNLENSEEITTVQRDQLKELLQGPRSYGFPEFKITTETEHFLEPHIQQMMIYQESMSKIQPHVKMVFVSFEIVQYDSSAAKKDNYIHEGNYTGKAVFHLVDDGFNAWKITDVRTTDFKKSVDGHWSGTYK